jgi:hypothetical protein
MILSIYYLTVIWILYRNYCAVLDAGYWILDAGYWMLDARYWMLDARYRMLDGYFIFHVELFPQNVLWFPASSIQYLASSTSSIQYPSFIKTKHNLRINLLLFLPASWRGR